MKKEIFDKYSKAVAKQFNLTLDEMFSKTKRQDIVEARQILYYLCKERFIQFSYIQRFLEESNSFEVDKNREKFYLSFNPDGYLKKRTD